MSKYLTPWLLAALLAAGCGSGPSGNLVIGDDDDAVGDDDDAVGDDDDAVGDDDDDGAPSLAGFYVGEMAIFGNDGDAFCDGDACFEVTDEGRMIGVALCPFGGGGGGGGGNPFEFSGAILPTGELDEGVATYERFGDVNEYELDGGIDPQEGSIDVSWEMTFGGGGGGFQVTAEAWGDRAADVDSCESIVDGDDDDGPGNDGDDGDDDDDDNGGGGGGPGGGGN